MKILMYPHGGSGNRGCEAIVRGTVKILQPDSAVLFSSRTDEDFEVGLSEICNIKEEQSKINKLSISYIKCLMKRFLFNQKDVFDVEVFKNIFKEADKNTVALSIGGDNYCYGEATFIYLINKMLRKKGIKTVLWGCSVDEAQLTEKMTEDLSQYTLIVARETLTYNAMKKINKNTVLYPDPAFQLNIIEPKQDDITKMNNTIGLNVSPMIIENETNQGMTLKNYCRLIEHIIDNTNMNIALIPHVIWDINDDRKPIDVLYEKCKNSGRVFKIEAKKAEEIKGYISKCRFFIGARTHSTIAAYSTCVPTLVIGYSVKAKGIAKDLFGTYENYVLPVQNLKKEDDLVKAFNWLYENENEIKVKLETMMPDYCSRVFGLIEVMNSL